MKIFTVFGWCFASHTHPNCPKSPPLVLRRCQPTRSTPGPVIVRHHSIVLLFNALPRILAQIHVQRASDNLVFKDKILRDSQMILYQLRPGHLTADTRWWIDPLQWRLTHFHLLVRAMLAPFRASKDWLVYLIVFQQWGPERSLGPSRLFPGVTVPDKCASYSDPSPWSNWQSVSGLSNTSRRVDWSTFRLGRGWIKLSDRSVCLEKTFGPAKRKVGIVWPGFGDTRDWSFDELRYFSGFYAVRKIVDQLPSITNALENIIGHLTRIVNCHNAFWASFVRLVKQMGRELIFWVDTGRSEKRQTK
jgi:hypothetical protein